MQDDKDVWVFTVRDRFAAEIVVRAWRKNRKKLITLTLGSSSIYRHWSLGPIRAICRASLPRMVCLQALQTVRCSTLRIASGEATEKFCHWMPFWCGACSAHPSACWLRRLQSVPS